MYECKHCHKAYINERFYSKHFDSCKPLVRQIEVLDTMIGKSAFTFFKRWLKSKQCMNTELSTFVNSRFYNSFIRFSKFVMDKKIANIDLYFNHMNKLRISPMIWTNNVMYGIYIKEMDRLSPIDSVNSSIITLKKLANIFNCEPDEVILKLYIGEIIELMYSRHLTPWYLLNSQHLKNVLGNPSITKFQHEQLEQFISPVKWAKIFKDNPKNLKEVKTYMNRLNL